MQLDPGCPLELMGVDLTHDARGMRGFVRLFNLSDRLVTGFEAVISWQTDGGPTSIPLRTGPIAASPHELIILPLEADAPGGTWSGLFFVQVDLEGAPPWKGSPKRLIEVEMPKSPSPKELEALRRVAGPDAAVRPHFDKDYWVCACGRANPGKSPGCDRCGRSRRECRTMACQLAEAFQTELTNEPVKRKKRARAGQSQSDTAFYQELRNRYLRQRTMLIRRTVTMLTAAVLIALIALTWTWLLGMQQRAKDIVPPTRIEGAEEAPPGGASNPPA